MAEPRRKQNIGGTIPMMGMPMFQPRINQDALVDYANPTREQRILSGVAGQPVTNFMGGVRNVFAGNEPTLRGRFKAGREGTAAAYERSRFQNGAQFERDQLQGAVSGAALGGLSALGGRAATLLTTQAPQLAGKVLAPGFLANLAGQGRTAATAALPAIQQSAGRDVGAQLVQPDSDFRVSLARNAGAAARNMDEGNVPGAIGAGLRTAGEGVYDLGKAALPNVSSAGPAAAQFMAGLAGDSAPGAAGATWFSPRGTAASTPAEAPASAPAVAPSATSYSSAGAGLTPQFAQALAGTQGAAPAPQTAPALKDDLMQSLDGLTIRQVVELAKARPTAPTPLKPASAKDQVGYQLLNFMNENLAAALANAQSDEERIRARTQHMQQLQSLFGDSLGSLLQSQEN